MKGSFPLFWYQETTGNNPCSRSILRNCNKQYLLHRQFSLIRSEPSITKIMKPSFLLFSVHLARAPVAGTSVVTPTPCKDDPEFRFKKKRDKTCKWVAEKALQRCEKKWKRIELSYYCPRSCGVCGPSPAPSTPPSGSPSTAPTAAPVTPAPTGCDPDLCFDDPDFKHQGLGRKDCDWVAKKVESRCNKVHNTKQYTIQAVSYTHLTLPTKRIV